MQGRIRVSLRHAAALIALLPAACSLQDSFVYFPDTGRPDLAALHLPPVQEVELRTADGLRLLAWWLPPQGEAPVILYCHGNGGNIAYRGDRMRFFASRGFGALMLEYRGYGGNPGRPSEEGLYADARAALAFLDAAGIPPERRVLYGESLGTGVAVKMATEQPVGALVLEAPYTKLEDVGAIHFPAPLVRLVLRDRFDSLSRIRAVNAPLLVLHGERDEVIPVALGRALYAAASQPKEVWYAPQGNHNDLPQFGGLQAAGEFIERRMAK
jgi:fermentation-respiration switch protein FrsA (DUF1100 family)